MNGHDDMLEPHELCKMAKKAFKATQEEMASMAGVSTTTVWRWENEKTAPPDTYLAVCDLALRLKQDGEGLEVEAFERIKRIPASKKSSKTALLELWGFCRDKGKLYIVNEMTGSSEYASKGSDDEVGERGPGSMEAAFNITTDFKESLAARTMKLPPELRDRWFGPVTNFSKALEEMKMAYEFEKAFLADTDEQGYRTKPPKEDT